MAMCLQAENQQEEKKGYYKRNLISPTAYW